jgi:hypothetical protein
VVCGSICGQHCHATRKPLISIRRRRTHHPPCIWGRHPAGPGPRPPCINSGENPGPDRLAGISRRRVDRRTLQGESAIVPGFALLSLTRAQRDTNGRVCSGELWVERLTNDDDFEGCQQRRPLLFGRLLLAQSCRSRCCLLRCICRLMALLGPRAMSASAPLLGAKRTWRIL